MSDTNSAPKKTHPPNKNQTPKLENAGLWFNPKTNVHESNKGNNSPSAGNKRKADAMDQNPQQLPPKTFSDSSKRQKTGDSGPNLRPLTNIDSKGSKAEQVKRLDRVSQYPYCLRCHRCHKTNAKCKVKPVRPQSSSTASPALFWKSAFTELEWQNVVKLFESAPGRASWYDLMTFCEISLQDLEPFHAWIGDRDVEQWKVCQAANTKFSDQEYRFFSDLVLMSNSISSQMNQEFRDEIRNFIERQFFYEWRKKLKDDGIHRSDQRFLSREVMLQNVKHAGRNPGQTGHDLLAFVNEGIVEKFIGALHKIVHRRNEAVSYLTRKISEFLESHSKPSFVARYSAGFKLQKDLVVQCHIRHNGTLRFDLPDLKRLKRCL